MEDSIAVSDISSWCDLLRWSFHARQETITIYVTVDIPGSSTCIENHL